MRADAQRNRDRLLSTALDAFTRDADATLESIAKGAGVGIGTLYRHFPTREALIEAVYRAELTKVCDAASELVASLPPDQAMRAWMDRFYDYGATKRGMADALKAVVASGVNPYAQSRALLTSALSTLLEAMGVDVDPVDVLASLSGVAFAAGEKREQASRLLDLLVDGLRYRVSPS
ncbi:TetR family transcriptional regulator [Lentzea sp. NBRC 105346]|uniref:TetR/AcrR family transcriptional regulator n=1 Tax=Lentzea sp. NBRC 105346 TaxID=3032205 RepID=UPI0024A2AB41|nr:TetR/AcrR family transcriptional regulator [Lentzea sp. NBRC 105346]GLZ33762.1 TetR family transcriptional regulator [Lentzea sp. NBRC 105346]